MCISHRTPSFFENLTAMGCCSADRILHTADGCYILHTSLAELLTAKGISSVPGKHGELPCPLFFDDWFLYAVPDGGEYVYSLFKLREQEYDKELGLHADGDTPGVTVCFLDFNFSFLLDALLRPCKETLSDFNRELGRVVSDRGQTHHRVLKDYFSSPAAEAPYRIAELYVNHVATLAPDGRLPVPKYYAHARPRRLARFLEANNALAGCTVCDHRYIYIRDPQNLSLWEQYAILATHTANTSYNSFAAEVLFHAAFLKGFLRRFLRPLYESAIRADMTVDKARLTGWSPYYKDRSPLLRRQRAHHGIR